MKKLRESLQATWKAHRDDGKEGFAKAMDATIKKSRIGRYMTRFLDEDNVVHIKQNKSLVEERRQLGRRLLFTTRTDLTARQVIRFYNHDKAALEENFKEIKSPDLVRLSPLRHFSPEFA